MKFILATIVALCLGSTMGLAGLFRKKNEVTKAIDSCSKESKNCKPNCIGTKLGYATATGELIPDKTPLYELCMMHGATAKCANSATGNSKCDKTNSQFKCNTDELEKVLEATSIQCAKDTNTPDAKPGVMDLINSIQNAKHACYSRCIIDNMGLLDANSSPNLVMLFRNLNVLKPAQLQSIIKDCAKQNNQADECTKVVKRATCAGFKVFFKIGALQVMKMKALLAPVA